VVLAGGYGTRLAPLTDNCPKIMVPVLGRPFAYWQLDLMKKWGVTEVVYCVNHLAHKVRELGDDYKGIRLLYSEEKNRPPDALWKFAVRNALPLLDEEFLLMYGDSYLPDVDIDSVKAFGPSLITSWQGIDYGLWHCHRSEFAFAELQIIERFHEIGSLEGLVELEAYLQNR
jgi:NDP-sugar pyrophosphorylase family protein